MQWLIDILAEKVIAEIGVPPCFIARGDLAVPDWTDAVLLEDGLWHTLDASAIIPSNATGILIRTLTLCGGIGESIIIKPSATSGSENQAELYTQVANNAIACDMAIGIDINQSFQYKITIGAWTFIHMSIKGWWL